MAEAEERKEPEQSNPQPVEQLDAEQLRAQLDEEKGKAQTYLANWQREAADFQNYKRRVEQERAEAVRLANATLIINLVPILDDLERALASLDVRLAGLTWFEGIAFILRKLQLVLESAGVRPIKAEGESFDPRYHEAVMQADGDEGRVVGEVQKGYMLGDRVLRPAMVIVGKGQPPAAKGEQAEEPKGEGQ